MRNRTTITLLYLLLCLFPAYSQSYNQLIQERNALLEQLEETEAQNSALFGKKSKKDLRNASEIMADIIAKDKQIIAAFRTELAKKENASQEPVEEYNQRLIELEGENAKLNTLVNQRNIEKANMDKELNLVKDRMFKYQTTILICFIIIFLLAIYIKRQRKKLKVQKPEVVSSQLTTKPL